MPGTFESPATVVFSAAQVFTVPAYAMYSVEVVVMRHKFAHAVTGDTIATLIDTAVPCASARSLEDVTEAMRTAVDEAAESAMFAAAAVIETAIRGAGPPAATRVTGIVRTAIDEAVDYGLLMRQLVEEMRNERGGGGVAAEEEKAEENRCGGNRREGFN